MKLIELVDRLKTLDNAKAFIANELPNVEVDQVDIYLKESLDINAEVRFFDAETIPNTFLLELDGIKYVNLFPFYMLQEMVEDHTKLSDKLSDAEIAKRILDYRIKDA